MSAVLIKKNRYFYLQTNDNGSMSLIRESAEEVDPTKTYYEINEDNFILETNNLLADSFPNMYLPGRYYYRVAYNTKIVNGEPQFDEENKPIIDPTKVIGSYLLDWTIDGSDIKNYGERDTSYGNGVGYICYRKKRSYQNYVDNEPEEIYIEKIDYEEIALTRDPENENYSPDYLPNVYYVLENNVYTLCSDKTFNKDKTYYKQVISYELRTNDHTYNIDDVLDRDPKHRIYLASMSFYQDNTYFVIRKDDPNDPNMITEYRSLTVYDLTQ